MNNDKSKLDAISMVQSAKNKKQITDKEYTKLLREIDEYFNV